MATAHAIGIVCTCNVWIRSSLERAQAVADDEDAGAETPKRLGFERCDG